MSSVAAPADRRFRRAHVKPARKRKRWEALLVPAAKAVVVAALIGYCAYRASEIVAHAHVLQIDRVVVRGNDRLSEGEVLALLTGLRGESLLWTDLDVWRRRLLASPWVRDAALRRSLPGTVDVVISERLPVGLGRIGADMYLVDDRGTVIDQYGPQYADLDLPIIEGLTPAAGETADDGRTELAARVIAALRGKPEIGQRLSEVDVSNLHDATVILSGDRAVIHLGDEQFLPRIESYLQLADALRERVADIDYVDLRFDDRIYVRPAGKVSAARRVKR